MIDLKDFIPRKRRRLTSLLGLNLDGSRLEGVVLRRVNGSLQVQQSFSATLSLDPLTAATELVGREIRNHLDAAGVRERVCVVGLPLKWVLTAHADVPELAAADLAGFLQLESERAFPCDAATLLIGSSLCKTAAGKSYGLLAGIPRTHLQALEKALRAARLKPVSFGLPITALQPPAEGAEGVLAVAIGETNVALQLTAGGGVAALRTVEGVIETTGRRAVQGDVLVREARITLGQLPHEVRDGIRRVRVFGPRELARPLADELELRFEAGGLKVEVAERYRAAEFGPQLPGETPVSPALSLAARHLVGLAPLFEFLPPHVTPWRQLATRYSSGKLRLAGATAGAAAALVVLLFAWQQWQLVRLETQWARMAPKVKDLEKVLQQTRQYRPWFDEDLRGLAILKKITEAFPEEGSVTAKAIEVRDLNVVTCTGVARDNAALLKTIDLLRASEQVSDLKLGQIRGKTPMQFTFEFRWNEGGRNP